MNRVFPLLMLLLLAAGCQTSTVETRRQERLTAYSALPQEVRELVDKGQIKVGMSEDAVYIAWGKPAEVLTSQNTTVTTVTWLYHGAWMQETRYWTYREVRRDNRIALERHLESDYNPRSYVSAEITFENGAVKQWRTLPRPLN